MNPALAAEASRRCDAGRRLSALAALFQALRDAYLVERAVRRLDAAAIRREMLSLGWKWADFAAWDGSYPYPVAIPSVKAIRAEDRRLASGCLVEARTAHLYRHERWCGGLQAEYEREHDLEILRVGWIGEWPHLRLLDA